MSNRTDGTPSFARRCLALLKRGLTDDRLFNVGLFTFVTLFVGSLAALFVADLFYVLSHEERFTAGKDIQAEAHVSGPRVLKGEVKAGPKKSFSGELSVTGGKQIEEHITGGVYSGRRSGMGTVRATLVSEPIVAAIKLSMITTGLTTLIGLVFAIPIGYALSRFRFPGHALIDSMIDLPFILPPLVVGLSLLVFFKTPIGEAIESAGVKFAFEQSGIVLCQLLVSLSLGVRAMKLTFDGIDPRYEHVAMTLGCSRIATFFRVTVPMSYRGMVVAAVLIWTRAFGLFGPLMIFVGAVRMRTEVLPTVVFLETSVGNLHTALAVALLMVVITIVLLVCVRTLGGLSK